MEASVSMRAYRPLEALEKTLPNRDPEKWV
jgi:hypothetical protein